MNSENTNPSEENGPDDGPQSEPRAERPVEELRERLDDAAGRVKDSIEKAPDNYIAALSYIPLVGWLIGYFGRSDSELVRFHARQSLNINTGIVIIYFMVWFLNKGPIISSILNLIAFHYVTNFVLWISIWAYLISTGMAAFKAYHGEQWPVPFLDKIKTRF